MEHFGTAVFSRAVSFREYSGYYVEGTGTSWALMDL